MSPVAGAIAVGRLDPEPALSNFPDAARQAETVADGSALALGIGLAFRLDGFSLLFALLISDKPKDKKGRFLTLIIAFMSAMLGTVLSDNLIVMFAFWELKSLLSFLLIGFEGEMLEARNSALQSLIVEPSGSLALFAGIVLIGSHLDTLCVMQVLPRSDELITNSLARPIAALVIIGAFAKSAQLPFHFRLPNAMAAPMPAYLDLATMVKLRVFLLARFDQISTGMPALSTALVIAGSLTMLVAGVRAAKEGRFKAYSPNRRSRPQAFSSC